MPKREVLEDESVVCPEDGGETAEYNCEHPERMTGRQRKFNSGNTDEFSEGTGEGARTDHRLAVDENPEFTVPTADHVDLGAELLA